MPWALDGDWWSTPYPGPLTPGKTWYSLCTVGCRVDIDGYQKILTPPTFEPQTIQPIASCYTVSAVLAVFVVMWLDKYHKLTILDQSIYFNAEIKDN
jgi:hypothetical protein